MSTSKTKTVIIIAGPTAAGKTAVAIRLAQALSTQIISADSRQCYREMEIGVAKPSAEELQLVKHYFIDSHSIHQPVNAAGFETYALESAKSIFTNNDVAVMVGGTGLYIKAFCEGLDNIPAIDPVLHQEINSGFNQFGLSWLQEQVKNADPLYFANGEIENPHRLMRALEVIRATGNSIRYYQKSQKKERDFSAIIIGILPPKAILQEQINNRVDKMIAAGLVDEAERLTAFRALAPLRTVGYSEIFEYLDNKATLEEAVENIKLHTRQYAKRQVTWFNKVPGLQWLHPEDDIMKAVAEAQQVQKDRY